MKWIIANWKMNPAKIEDAVKLVSAIQKAKTKYKIVICPPFIYLSLLKTKLDLGAQDMFWEDKGAYTGEISAAMLKQTKAKYAIIGHSERRNLGETDHEINMKIKAALQNKIQPILCVGHGLEMGQKTEDIMAHLQDQLSKDLQGVDPAKVMVAYEPVWAIGSGNAATPEHAEKISMFIKIKFKIKKVLYGGSTNAANSKLFLKKDIDGLLVGGSSLNAKEFIKMIGK